MKAKQRQRLPSAFQQAQAQASAWKNSQRNTHTAIKSLVFDLKTGFFPVFFCLEF
jgi:hypothetical protein